MIKIGVTRRLDPMDRVIELGDASVPFRCDVHAMVFHEDAVSLETHLHQALAERKVNRINPRREFFYANLQKFARSSRKWQAHSLSNTGRSRMPWNGGRRDRLPTPRKVPRARPISRVKRCQMLWPKGSSGMGSS